MLVVDGAGGTAIELPATLVGNHLAGNLLYGIAATDPLSVAAAVLVLMGAGLLAGYLPEHAARPASTCLPALRYE